MHTTLRQISRWHIEQYAESSFGKTCEDILADREFQSARNATASDVIGLRRASSFWNSKFEPHINREVRMLQPTRHRRVPTPYPLPRLLELLHKIYRSATHLSLAAFNTVVIPFLFPGSRLERTAIFLPWILKIRVCLQFVIAINI